MNKYIKQMKDKLNEVYNAEVKAKSDIKNINSKYQEEFARPLREKALNELEMFVRSAKDDIMDIRDAAINEVRKWNSLKGADLDEDVRLFKYDLNKAQFDELVERHRKNGTMCFALYQYAMKHNKERGLTEGSLMDYLDTTMIPTAENKIQAYSQFADSALSLIGTLDDSGLFAGPESPMITEAVKTFGEPNQVNAMMLYVIE